MIWIESVIQGFIDKKQFNGNLTDNQFYSFSKSMKDSTVNGFRATIKAFTYEYKDYTFTVWNNKFTLINNKDFERKQLERNLEDYQSKLEMFIEYGNQEKIEKYQSLIKEVKRQLK